MIRRDLRGVVGTLSAGAELKRLQGGGTPRALAEGKGFTGAAGLLKDAEAKPPHVPEP